MKDLLQILKKNDLEFASLQLLFTFTETYKNRYFIVRKRIDHHQIYCSYFSSALSIYASRFLMQHVYFGGIRYRNVKPILQFSWRCCCWCSHPVTSGCADPYARCGWLHLILGWTIPLRHGHIPFPFNILLRKQVHIGYGAGCTNINSGQNRKHAGICLVARSDGRE